MSEAPRVRVRPIFAIPLAEVRHPEPDELLANLREQFLRDEQDPARMGFEGQKVIGGAIADSRNDLFLREEAPLRQLRDFCHDALRSLVQALARCDEATLDSLRFCYHAWFHVTRAGGHQALHIHPNASWSGVFCVDRGDEVAEAPDSGVLRFHHPSTHASMHVDPGNTSLREPFNLGGYEVEHEPGVLILFPSFLAHEVLPYRGDRPRIVVAFNCWIEGAARAPHATIVGPSCTNAMIPPHRQLR